MSDSFSFVEEGLVEVKKGDPNRTEIFSLIDDFKESVADACKKLYRCDVSFEGIQYGLLCGTFPGLRRRRTNSGDVTVYIGGFRGLHLFRYELDPLLGYPVTLFYAGRTVRCENGEALLLSIRDAYSRSVGELKDFCENGFLGLQMSPRLSPLPIK